MFFKVCKEAEVQISAVSIYLVSCWNSVVKKKNIGVKDFEPVPDIAGAHNSFIS
jgi:hypothetical protein